VNAWAGNPVLGALASHLARGDAVGPTLGNDETELLGDRPVRSVALGTIVGARSGDKGGNANIGLWVRSDGAYVWLRHELTSPKIKGLLPETAHLHMTGTNSPGSGVSISLCTDSLALALHRQHDSIHRPRASGNGRAVDRSISHCPCSTPRIDTARYR
jgi:hypothetical protein